MWPPSCAGLSEQGTLYASARTDVSVMSDPLLDLGRTRCQVGVGFVGLGLEMLGVDVLAVAEHLDRKSVV